MLPVANTAPSFIGRNGAVFSFLAVSIDINIINWIITPMSSMHILNVLVAFMDQVHKSGFGIDNHETDLYDPATGMFIRRRHIFDGYIGIPKTILTHESEILPKGSSCGALGLLLQDSFVRISLCDVWPDDVDVLLRAVIEKYGYDRLFENEGDVLRLGPFFSFPSALRDRLLEVIDSPVTPHQIGYRLWQTISACGGLRALRENWETLYEERLKREILLLNPFCLDPK